MNHWINVLTSVHSHTTQLDNLNGLIFAKELSQHVIKTLSFVYLNYISACLIF